MFDGAGQHFSLRGAFLLAQERLDDEVGHIPRRHEAEKPPQQPERLDGIVQELVEEQPLEPLTADLIDHFSGQAGRIDRRNI